MSKTQKELAYLRDLYLTNDWTERFTNLIDEHIKLPKKGRFLYVNAGTGTHVIALREKLKNEVELTAIAENKDLLKIADAKAKVMRSEINFQTFDKLAPESYDTVLADAVLIKPLELEDFLPKVTGAAKAKGNVAFFLPTAGSFGEIFSLLWEVLFNADLAGRGAEVERLISEIPTVSEVEEMAGKDGLTKIESLTKIEIFEYDTGAEFAGSPLVAEFLLPFWLDFLSEKEKKQVSKKLAQIVDTERDGLTFRFSVKLTLFTGEKK